MRSQIDIDLFREYFKNRDNFTFEQVNLYFQGIDISVPKATVTSRIYALRKKEIIQCVGRGVYKLGATKEFHPILSPKLKKINQQVKIQFPYIEFCIWDLSFFNTLSKHLINYNVIFIDVEREATQSVYLVLKETFSKAMLSNNLYDDISEFTDYIIVRPLISGSPISKIGAVNSPTIEKILVDLYTDKEFEPFQGGEIFTLFKTAFEKYTINESKLLRYADRKEKKNRLKNFINSNIRQ